MATYQSMHNSICAEQQQQQCQVETELKHHLWDPPQHCMDLALEKGSSTWLEALPMKEHGFSLWRQNSTIRCVCIMDGFRQDFQACVCGAAFDMKHALSCPTGGLLSVGDDEIRDTLVNISTEVCSDVATESALPSGDDEKHLDIHARGFWGGQIEVAFFDVRVFKPFAASAVFIQP